MPEMLTVEQACAALQLAPITVRRMIKDSVLAGAVKVGRSWRVPRTSVESVLRPKKK